MSYLPFNMRQLLLQALIGLSIASCNTNNRGTQIDAKTALQGLNKETLQVRKVLVDTLLSQRKGKLLVFVKVPKRHKLIEVKNENWPEEIETTYNVLKDTSGHIVMFLESPYSESGDWNITLSHYFDADGKTFAFSKRTNFFNSGCTEGVAYEAITEYYDKSFKRLSKEYKLVDENGKALSKPACEIPYDEPYTVKPNANLIISTLKLNGR